MTLNVETPRVVYSGSGTRGPFALSVGGTPITYTASSHIIAERYSDAGVLLETLVEGVDYDLSVTSVATGDSAATLTIDASADVLAADEKLVIRRSTTLSQTLALTQGGGFSSSANEANYDKIVRILQELSLELGRQITINPVSSGVGTDLPVPAAGYVLAWNADGDALENLSAIPTDAVAVSVAWAAVIEKASIALGLTEAGFSAFVQTLIGATDAATARTTLDAQQLDADLTAIAALGYTTGNYLPKKSAANTWSLITITTAGQNILDDDDKEAQRATLGAFGKVTRQVFTSSGTYTPNADMLYCSIECVGGGGGGGGAAGATAGNVGCAGGGGGGGYSRKLCTASDIGASKTVTIGAGGGGGSAGNNNGTAGGDTSVGTLCIGKGGSGGGGGASNARGNGGAGGVVGTGDFSVPGQGGENGIQASIITVLLKAGGGGGSALGFGGGAAETVNNSAGTAGSNYGGAGGGGFSANGGGAQAGGAGAGGIVVITEFCK